ncbi:LptA/OstA family protein [candidate division KSB1 bacterium]
MRYAGITLLAAVTCCVIHSATALGQDRIELRSSDLGMRESVDGKIVDRVFGNVYWYNPERDLHIYCDTTEFFRNDQRYILLGNVTIVDPEKILRSDKVLYFQDIEEAYIPGPFIYREILHERSLTADRGTYFYGKEQLNAWGNVIYADSVRTLSADSAVYYEAEQIGSVFGNVRIKDNSRDAVADGEFGEYYQKENYTFLTGSPRIAIADSTSSDSLIITGLKMEYFGGDTSRFVVTDSAVITKGSLSAMSRIAIYDRKDSVIYLRDNPRILQDSTRINGTEIDLIVAGETVNEVIVREEAVAVMPADSTGIYDCENVLSGKTLHFFLEDGEIRKIIASKNAFSDYYQFSQDDLIGKHILSGEQIILYFSNGVVDSLISDFDKSEFVPKRLLPDIKKKLYE